MTTVLILERHAGIESHKTLYMSFIKETEPQYFSDTRDTLKILKQKTYVVNIVIETNYFSCFEKTRWASLTI